MSAWQKKGRSALTERASLAVDWATWWSAHGEAAKAHQLGGDERQYHHYADEAERGRLKVHYDGKPVDDPNIIVLRLGNTVNARS